MHFHALDGSFRAVVILIHIASHLLWTVGSWLFAIIKCLEHPCVGTRLGQQEVVLEYAVASLSRLLLRCKLGWSIILQVLHEPRLGFVHNIIVMGSALLWGVVKPRSCLICSLAEAWGVHPIVVILVLASDGASSTWKLASGIGFVWLIESVSVAISCRFTTSASRRMVSTRNLRIERSVWYASWLIIYWLLAIVRWVRGGVELLIIVVIFCGVAVHRHVIDWIACSTSLSLFP